MALGTGFEKYFGENFKIGVKQVFTEIKTGGTLVAGVGFQTDVFSIGGANKLFVGVKLTRDSATKIHMTAECRHPNGTDWMKLQVPNGGASDIVDAQWDKAVSASVNWLMEITPVAGDAMRLNFDSTDGVADDTADVCVLVCYE